MKKAGNRPDRNIYAAYRGEEYIGEGTLDEIAALAGVSRRTAQWCKCPVAVCGAWKRVRRNGARAGGA